MLKNEKCTIQSLRKNILYTFFIASEIDLKPKQIRCPNKIYEESPKRDYLTRKSMLKQTKSTSYPHMCKDTENMQPRPLSDIAGDPAFFIVQGDLLSILTKYEVGKCRSNDCHSISIPLI